VTAAAVPSGRSLVGGRRRALSRNQALIVALAILVFLIVVYQVQSGALLTAFQLRIIVNGAMATVFAALGLTFVIVVGGFDLSIGAVISLTNVLAATLLTGSAIPDVPLIGLLLIIGLVIGAINGLLVVFGRLQSFIVTLATMFIWSGLALLLLPQPGGLIPASVSDALAGRITDWIPAGIVWLAGVVLVLAVFRRSRVWDHLFAVGSDEAAAERAGVPTGRIKVGAFAIAGMCYAIAGLFLSAQSTGGDANIGNPFLLTTFAAVIVGGTPLGGGRGTFAGSIVGAFVIATLGTVLLSLGVTSYMTDVAHGAVLLLAVVIPTTVARYIAKRRKEQLL
jgi:ribose transport system permease protein